jgi:hypothetical protein
MSVKHNGGLPPATIGTSNPNIFDTSMNRRLDEAYDNAGNQTSVNGYTASYDEENRMVAITNLPAFGGGTEELVCDGGEAGAEDFG